MRNILIAASALLSCGLCMAQETGRVLSSTPVVQQVEVPRQVCAADPAQAQNPQRCTTQTYQENRTVAYTVVYEYAGKQYTVQLPKDPGPAVQLQIAPVDALQATSTPAQTSTQTITVQPSTVYVTQPVYGGYYAPPTYPYYPSYYPPVSIGLGIGFWGGFRGHHHWR